MNDYNCQSNNKNGRIRRIQILVLYFAFIIICCFNPTSYSFSPPVLKRPNFKSPIRFTRKLVSIEMGAKGDGKQRRKKQSSSPSPSSTPQQSQQQQQQPQRVSNNINIPIRRQIQYGKINKQLRENGSGGTASFRQRKVVRTKYRRTWDEEEIELKAEERRRKGQNPNWDVILNQTKANPLLIVDGYNIIHKWSRLKKHMVKGDPARARQLLIDDLENMRSIKGWRIEVVFDGAGKDFRVGPLGDTLQRRSTTADKAGSKDVSKHGVRVVFTGTGIGKSLKKKKKRRKGKKKLFCLTHSL